MYNDLLSSYFVVYYFYSPFCRGYLTVCLGNVEQWSPTPGPRTGTGPWLNQYWAAQELISYSCFIFSGTILKGNSLLHLQLVEEEVNINHKCKLQKIINCARYVVVN